LDDEEPQVRESNLEEELEKMILECGFGSADDDTAMDALAGSRLVAEAAAFEAASGGASMNEDVDAEDDPCQDETVAGREEDRVVDDGSGGISKAELDAEIQVMVGPRFACLTTDELVSDAKLNILRRRAQATMCRNG
jgi:hypothetical protein